MAWKKAPVCWALLFALLFHSWDSAGSSSVGAYLTPHFGYSWHQFHALEIEESFISAGDDAPTLEGRPAVGNKAHYKGGGFTVGVGGGIRLFDLKLGLLYLYASPDLSGESKTYEYSSDLQRATGNKRSDSGGLDVHRVLADFHYVVPVWRFEVSLKTRVGAALLRDKQVSSISGEKGFTGDLGLGLSFFLLEFLSVGVEGYFGFFSFSGKYKGVYGIVGGVGGCIQIGI